MEIKKCTRCGVFFSSTDLVCSSCLTKDSLDKNNLQSYLENQFSTTSVADISINTGISLQNINRFLQDDTFSKYNITDIDFTNISNLY